MTTENRWLTGSGSLKQTRVLGAGLAVLALVACQSATPGTASPTDAPSTQPAATTTEAPEESTAPKPVTVRMGITGPFLTVAQAYLADSLGYYDDHGVTIEATETPGVTGAQALLAGDIDMFVSGSTDVFLLAGRGEEPLAFISLFDQQVHTLSVSPAALEERGISVDDPLEERLAALEGMSLAVSGSGSATDTTLGVMLEAAGLTDADIQGISIEGGQAGRIAALEAGQIDGYVSAPFADIQTQEAGTAVIFIRANELEEFSEGFVFNTVYSTREWVEDNADAVRAVAAALADANEFIVSASDEDLIAALQSAEWADVDAEVLRLSMDVLRPTVPPDGRATPEQWEAVMNYSLTGELIEEPVSVDEGEYWTNEYLP